MGWASGSEIAEKVWKLVAKELPEKSRRKVAKKMIEIFRDHDCDTMDEAEELMAAAKGK